MNFINILSVACNGDIKTIIGAIKTVFTLIQWAIPLVLIVMGTIDMFKAMASGDEKKTKEAKDKFIRRLIYAVVAFLIPFIISLVFTFVGKLIENDGKSTYDNFFTCWKQAGDDIEVDADNQIVVCKYPNGDLIEVSRKACLDANGTIRAE